MKKIYLVISLTFFLLQGAFSQNCPPADVPDVLFQDINGDGIDGDITHAIFVAVSGSDTYPGTMQQPVKTIQKGIQLASVTGKDVYVSRGTYVLTSPLQMVSGVSLYGQFDCTNNWARSNADTTIISGIQTAIFADNMTSDTHIEGFVIRSANATTAGESSYAIRVNGGSAKTIIRFNILKPGSGGNGTIGTNGTSGQMGSLGSNGGIGSCDGAEYGIGGLGGYSPCGQTGGNGGNGGMEGDNAGINGGVGFTGTLGGNGGSGGDPGSPGQNGYIGTAGANGANGIVSPLLGTTTSVGIYTPSAGNSGTAGAGGNGGGGAGGGGGQGCTFCNNGSGNGGGGGGGGGCAGTVGTGGTSGGGSFGVFVYNSVAVIDRNKIITSTGGVGAAGGNGGIGGVGGSGGIGGTTCTGEVGAGGNGGNGGTGGASGSGSGGAGGPSIGIFISGYSTVQADTNYFTLGMGGTGGAGGTNAVLFAAPAGPLGTAANIHGVTASIPVIVPGICINDVTVQEPTTGSVYATFKVSLSSPAQVPVSVSYTTIDGTAHAGTDYTATSGVLTFVKDEIVKSVHVSVLGGVNTGGGFENFTLNLSNPLNATIVDNSGLCTITELSVGIDQANDYPGSCQLLQNNPNPFNGETEIIYGLPQQKEVTLKVYNLTGQMVSTLVEGKSEAGWHHVVFNSKELPAGIYVYRLVTNDVLLTKKLTVIK